MPAAVPMIVGAAATAGAGIAVGGAFTLANAGMFFGTFTGAIISGAASLATSGLLASLNRPDKPSLSAQLATPGAGRTQQLRQPIVAHQVPFGRIKLSGPILFVHTTEDDAGRANGYLYLVHGLSGVEVAAIGDVYLGDELAVSETYEDLARIGKHLGTAGQTADTDLVSEIGDPHWGADHRLRGRAYVATRLKWDDTAYPSGIPNVSAIVNGHNQIYDPRTGSTGWTNNAALCIARWFTAGFGMSLAWVDLDEDSVIAAANICDERVTVQSRNATVIAEVLPGSPTVFTNALAFTSEARELDVGDGVRFTTTGTLPSPLIPGTTYYAIPSERETVKVATSPANAITGTAITLSTSGTGTHTLFTVDEARYKLNGSFALDAAKGDTLKQLLSAMSGVAVYIGGKWFLHAGAAAAPTITLTEDDLRGEMGFIPKRSMRDRFNAIRGVYVNPSANWQPVDAPPRENATYLEEDDGEELVEDVTLNFTTSTAAAQRLMKISLEANRRQGIVNFPAKLTAMRLQPWDGVYLSIERYGWTQKQFRVIGWTLAEDGGVDLTLQEDDAGIYTWSSSEEIDTAVQQGVVLPDPSAIDAPQNLTVQTPETPTYSRVFAEWDPVLSIWLARYDVEYRAAGSGDWMSFGAVGHDAATVAQIERSAATDIRVRAVTKNGAPSNFTTDLAPATPTGGSATGGNAQITVDADVSIDTAEIQIFEHDTATFGASTLLDTITPGELPFIHSGLGESETHHYWLRAVNTAGNVSAETSVLSATTEEGGGD